MGADDQAHSKHVMTLSKMQKTIVIALLNNQMALKLKYEVSRKYHYTLNVLLQYILVCKSTFNNVGAGTSYLNVCIKDFLIFVQ